MQIETIITPLAANFQVLGRIPADRLRDAGPAGDPVITAIQSLTGLAGLHHTEFLRRVQDAETAITLAYARTQATQQRIRQAGRQEQQGGSVDHITEADNDMLTC